MIMRLLQRIWNILYGATTNVVLFFEKRNPEALLTRERERFRSIVSDFNNGLVTHATLIERLKSSVAEHEKQISQTTSKINAVLRSGDRRAAGRNAINLQTLQATVSTDREKLQAAESKYQALVEARDDAVAETRKRIEHLRQQIGDLKVNRAVADLENMAAAMVGSINNPGEDLNRLTEMLNEENERALARVRVATGSREVESSADRRAENDSLAAQALEDYLAEGKSEPLALPDFTSALVQISTIKRQ
jgi:phage shock protein A